MNRGLWTLLALAVILGSVWELYPLQDARSRLEQFPLNGIGFNGYALDVTDVERENLPGVNILKRYYRVGATEFLVHAIDGTHNRNAVHDPSYCYTGGGWSIAERRYVPIDRGWGEVISLEKEHQRKEVVIWFTDQERIFARPLEYWWRATLRRLTLGISGEEPVRVVLQPVGSYSPDWNIVLREFPALKSL